MSIHIREAEDIIPDDFRISPVWEFLTDFEAASDTLMKAVMNLPVRTLGNRVAGLQVRLANGEMVWGSLCNVDMTDELLTRQFIFLSVYKQRWFHLERYFDPLSEQNGPAGLAAFLGMPIDDVFPIAYDLRPFCLGSPKCLAGSIGSEPAERLTDDQRTALIFHGSS